MTAIQLKNFIDENNCEYHWFKDDVILFINHFDIENFRELFSWRYLCNNEIKCVMKDYYFCFHMKDMCDHFDIDMNEIFINKD